jgi:serine/threonine-protein kinase
MCPNCGKDNRDTGRFCAFCQAQLQGLLGSHVMLQNRYEIINLLGCGGMGAVYLALDHRLGQNQVAVKENFDTSSQAQTQFRREANVLAKLSHPNLPKVTDHFIEPTGRQYLVMEYVAGNDLDTVVQQRGALPESQVLAWADELLDALTYLHGQPQPIIHRDIKPANIKMTPDGKVKLVDFGLVKSFDPTNPRTSTSMRGLGTPEYAPPEQYNVTGHTDQRSDLYALGATLYYLLTAQAPVTATMRMANPAVLRLPRQLSPSLRPSTEAAIMRAIELPMNNRFQTALEMRQALRGVAAPQPASAKKTNWLWRGLGAAVIVVALCAAGILLFGKQRFGLTAATPTQVVSAPRGTATVAGATAIRPTGATTVRATDTPAIKPSATLVGTLSETLTPTAKVPTVIPTPTAAAASGSMMQILLAEPGNPTVLSNKWTWFPGASDSSNHRLSPEDGALTLITGPGTDLWDDKNSAPRVEYPVIGDFQVQARLDFSPSEQWQVAGLGLRSTKEPGTWVALRRLSGGGSQQEMEAATTRGNRSETIASIPYAKPVTYLKVGRVGERLSFAVSENGINWIELRTAHIFSLPDQVNLFLYVYSTSGHGILSKFSDVRLGAPQSRQGNSAGGPVAFASASNPNQLSDVWGWYPGGSDASTFKLAGGQLMLITGPGTDLWDDRDSAPRVEYPVIGDFQVQVRLDFSPSEQYQVAGLGLRSTKEPGDWVALRRLSGGGSQQEVWASTTRGNRSENIATIPYTQNALYLRIWRTEPLVSLYYSPDGSNWTPLAKDFVMGFPDQVWVFLFVYSTSGRGISATFSNLTVTAP